MFVVLFFFLSCFLEISYFYYSQTSVAFCAVIDYKLQKNKKQDLLKNLRAEQRIQYIIQDTYVH